MGTRLASAGVVTVVSAMNRTTDPLAGLAGAVAPEPARRELDIHLATGEQVSTSLLAMAIEGLGVAAIFLTGEACSIVTNAVHGNARILDIRATRVREELRHRRVVVAAGFQGVSVNGELTTLGRGGSGTTAVALAAALGAHECQIFTDVDGVYDSDPRVIDEAGILDELASGAMQELAWQGAQVLTAEAVELARSSEVDVVVRGASERGPGTRVPADSGDEPAYVPRRPPVSGVSGREDLLRLTGHPAGPSRRMPSGGCSPSWRRTTSCSEAAAGLAPRTPLWTSTCRCWRSGTWAPSAGGWRSVSESGSGSRPVSGRPRWSVSGWVPAPTPSTTPWRSCTPRASGPLPPSAGATP